MYCAYDGNDPANGPWQSFLTAPRPWDKVTLYIGWQFKVIILGFIATRSDLVLLPVCILTVTYNLVADEFISSVLWQFVAWALLFFIWSNRWLCWEPTSVALWMKIVFAMPFLSIVRASSRTSSTLKSPVVRRPSLLYLAEVYRCADNIVNCGRFTYIVRPDLKTDKLLTFWSK